MRVRVCVCVCVRGFEREYCFLSFLTVVKKFFFFKSKKSVLLKRETAV